MSDNIEDSNTTDYSKKAENPVVPPVVRRKNLGDVILDRAAETSADVLRNNILPGVVDLFHDAVLNVVDGLFDRRTSNGRRRPRVGASASTQKTSFSYNGISSKEKDRKRTISERARANHEFDDILFQNRVEATDVIDRMRDHIAQYENATIDILYSFIGIDPTVQDTSWGWDEASFTGAHVRRSRGGFVLDIPAPSAL